MEREFTGRSNRIQKVSRGALCLLWSIVLPLLGCGSDQKAQVPASDPATDLELARVDGRAITLGDLRAFFERMPESLQNDAEGVEKVKDHLQTLIDMDLLQREALARGIDSTAAYLANMRRYERDRLVGFYLRDRTSVSLTSSEVRSYFSEQQLGRRVRFGQIVAGNLDSALAAIRDIDSGMAFEKAVRLWSIHEKTAARGGDTGQFISRKEISPEMAEILFGLSAGEISPPLDLGGAYGIFTVIDELEEEHDGEALASAYQQLYFERSSRKRRAIIDSLAGVYGISLEPEQFLRFLAALGASDWQAAAAVERVFSYDGGEITGAEVLDAIDPLERRQLAKMSENNVEERLRRGIVADELLLKAARSEGYAEHTEVESWLAQKRMEQLVVQLRVQVIGERVSITEEDVRREYETKPDRYRRSVQIEIREVLLESETEANMLAKKVRAGESIEKFVEMTQRPLDERNVEGRMTLTLADATRGFGRLATAAYNAGKGELVGPVHVPGGYSVFEVLSRTSEPATFEESELRARATARFLRKREAFKQYLKELRRKYSDIVTLNERNLKLAPDEPLGSEFTTDG